MTEITNDPTYNYLLNLLSDTTDKNKLAILLNVMLTAKEQQEIVNRLKIFSLLQQKATQREISTELGVGIATVSRGAKIFQQYDIKELFPEIENKMCKKITK